MARENEIERIVNLFKAMVEKNKPEVAILIDKEAWTSWDDFKRNADKITSMYNQLGEFLLASKVLIEGEDGIFSIEDEDRLINDVAEMVDKIIDIPMTPDFAEKKIFSFLVHSGYNLAKEKFQQSPQLMKIYKAYADKISNEKAKKDRT